MGREVGKEKVEYEMISKKSVQKTDSEQLLHFFIA